MTDKAFSELGKLVIDVLTGFERLQYCSVYDKNENPHSTYFLYSSMLKLMNRVLCPTERNSRLFRLKYHHILSNDSVDEYLLHCLSKIVADLLDIDNNYEKFIGPVEQLHMKLMSILTNVQLDHVKLVLANRRVASQLQKRLDKSEQEGAEGGEPIKKPFVPIYFLPGCCTNKTLFKNQSLSLQAVHSYYSSHCYLATNIMEMLRDFDDAFAEFELEFVCQVNRASIYAPSRAELTMDVAVMFSEAVQWARSIDLLEVRSIADCDIEIMVGVPRLAVVYGCRVAKHGPLSERALNYRHEHEIERRLAPVFVDHRAELSRLRRQLNVLTVAELAQLGRLLMDQGGVCSSPGRRRRHRHRTLDNDNDDDDNDDTSGISVSCFMKPMSRGTAPPPVQPSGDMHNLFKLVSSVSDQMQSEHASDYRFFMETVYKLYKDEVDYSSGSLTSSTNSKSFQSSCDLFANRYHNVHSYFTSIIEEAVDALSYSAADPAAAPSDDNQFDDLSLSQWNFKAFQTSRLRVPDYSSSQETSLRQSLFPLPIESQMECSRPEWREDTYFPRCCHCNKSFNVFRRRHHCRRCGYLFCSACWGTKVALPNMGIHNKVSICVECEEFLVGGSSEPAARLARQEAS